MATFQKIISGNEYCQGGSTVYVANIPASKNDRCDNSTPQETMEGRVDDTQYYGKKITPSTRAFSSGWSNGFS